jgi:hypothetical protein
LQNNHKNNVKRGKSDWNGEFHICFSVLFDGKSFWVLGGRAGRVFDPGRAWPLLHSVHSMSMVLGQGTWLSLLATTPHTACWDPHIRKIVQSHRLRMSKWSTFRM